MPKERLFRIHLKTIKIDLLPKIFLRFIRFLINSFGLAAFFKLALVLYSVHGQIGQSIKGKSERRCDLTSFDSSPESYLSFPDSISEFDLLTVALSDPENINNGGRNV